VKNPSCESVEVVKTRYDGTKSLDKYWSGEYKIIIPKEEAKQETLEEVGTYQQKLFNYLSDLGVIALQSEMQEIETIVLEMQQQDDFAIGFAEWCDETTTQVSKGEWANWLPDAKNCLSTKELLEQFKNK
jgi:hypothetical protein